MEDKEFPAMREIVPSGATTIEINEDADMEYLANLFTLSEEIDRARHIDSALRTLYAIMNDSSAKGTERVSAAKLTLEACGALGKSTTNNTFIKTDNAQINNTQVTDEDASKLKNAMSGIGKLLNATDAGIRLHEGGQG